MSLTVFETNTPVKYDVRNIGF